MHIHTSAPESVIWNASRRANCWLSRFQESGSRSHAAKYDVILASATRETGRRNADGAIAATWDEWGTFLAEIFEEDPHAKTSAYRNAEHFAWATGNRYAADYEPCNHKWHWQGDAATGAYSVDSCAKCGAIRRFARDWEAIAA